MLLCTKTHFIKSLKEFLSGEEGPGSTQERKQAGEEMKQRIRDYASDESGLLPGPVVMSWNARSSSVPIDKGDGDFGTVSIMMNGISPRAGQRIIYVDGGFDLFSSGHIEFLRQVIKREDELGHSSGWFEKAASEARIERTGEDYGPAFVIAGIHDDTVINYWKGVNYPIMNIFERGLCVLQCRVSFAPTPLYVFYPLGSTDSIKSTLIPSSSRPLSSPRKHTSCKSPLAPRTPSIMARPPLCRSRTIRTSKPRIWASTRRSAITTSSM